MPQLTQQHFDEQLKTLATKADLKPLATKDELSARLTEQTRQLKAYTDTQVSDLHSEMNERFNAVDSKLDALVELLDVRKDVDQLKLQIKDIRHALKLDS